MNTQWKGSKQLSRRWVLVKMAPVRLIQLWWTVERPDKHRLLGRSVPTNSARWKNEAMMTMMKTSIWTIHQLTRSRTMRGKGQSQKETKVMATMIVWKKMLKSADLQKQELSSTKTTWNRSRRTHSSKTRKSESRIAATESKELPYLKSSTLPSCIWSPQIRSNKLSRKKNSSKESKMRESKAVSRSTRHELWNKS